MTELKAKLSEFVRYVRRGGELHILAHGKPVARLAPLLTDNARRARLIAAGIIRARQQSPQNIAPLDAPGVDLRDALDALRCRGYV